MDHPQTIEVLVRRVAREVRVRRAEHWGLRGAFWGALVAAAVLVFKAALGLAALAVAPALVALGDRKSTRLNSSHTVISYAVFCLKKKKKDKNEVENIQLWTECCSTYGDDVDSGGMVI